ncbi:MAG TPA: glycosyltransferase family 2 protein [Kiritimatiellia bacterium]|nr:glycosyltransferase family 2 protein [Kiritimatiellia bacterium]
MNEDIRKFLERTLVLIPAYNEEASLPSLLSEVREFLPGADVAVVDDGSADQTATVAARAGARVLRLPCNLGVGPAVQTGFRYALEKGCDFLLRLDADGQHPPEEALKLVETMIRNPTDLIVGTRYGEDSTYHGNWARRFVLKGLAVFVSVICRKRITDPTSGFWLVSRSLLKCFAFHYPSDYPEPEAIALLRRQGFSMEEVPVAFRPRQAGESSIRAWGTVNFAAKVFLALFVDRLRSVDPRGSAAAIKQGEGAL